MRYKGLKPWRYANNLRDFINNDLRITRDEKFYYFKSKREEYCFAKLPYSVDYSAVLLFQIADQIFFNIINMRENEAI